MKFGSMEWARWIGENEPAFDAINRNVRGPHTQIEHLINRRTGERLVAPRWVPGEGQP